MLGIFTWLGQFLYNALKYLFQGLEAIFGPVLVRMIPILCPVGYALYWVVSNLAGWINQAESYLSAIKLPATNLNGLTGLALANTFFPLTEGMVLLGVYLTAVMTLNLYRLVKSWIPTLS